MSYKCPYCTGGMTREYGYEPRHACEDCDGTGEILEEGVDYFICDKCGEEFDSELEDGVCDGCRENMEEEA